MTSALVTITPDQILLTADTLLKSGFLPQSIKNVSQAFAIITLSNELGIGMWQGLNGINVIQGKPTVSPQLMLALINRSGQLEDMTIDANAERAIVTMKRKGRTPHTETFSFKDAAAQNLSGKDNYKKQPATMLKWRAVAACARVVFPDAIMGLYTTEEIAPDAVNLTDDGEAVMIERPAEPTPQPAPVVDTPDHDALRIVHITDVKRIQQGWAMKGNDEQGRRLAVRGLKSRRLLGMMEGAADGWDKTLNAETKLEEIVSVWARFNADANEWRFVEAVGGGNVDADLTEAEMTNVD